MQAGNQNTELAPVTRLRKREVPNVEFHVEIGILHPIGAIKIPRHLDEARAKDGVLLESTFEIGNHTLEAHETTRRRRRVVNPHTAHMLRRVGVLQIDKCRVEYT